MMNGLMMNDEWEVTYSVFIENNRMKDAQGYFFVL